MLLPYLQSPAGNRTPPVSAGSAAAGFASLAHWTPYWFGSGTAALAAAVRAAAESGAPGPRARPTVLMAAYGCPDLVAAVRYAGAEPLFVDVEENGFRIDPASAREALSTHDAVVALIGVDLFGHSEDWPALVSLCREFRIHCIRDCAQSLQARSAIDDDRLTDCQVYSFGRGKPLYLQGGGALLVPGERGGSLESRLSAEGWGIARGGYNRFREAGYNLLLNPYLYALAAHVLGRQLGRTEYRELESIERAPERFAALANAAIDGYWRCHRDRAGPVIDRLAALREEFPALLHPARSPGDSILNRVPVIVSNRELRDDWMARLRRHGLSATDMYGRALPDIEGVIGVCTAGGIARARSLASRLLTIPAHARLTDRDFDTIVTTFRDACGALERDGRTN